MAKKTKKRAAKKPKKAKQLKTACPICSETKAIVHYPGSSDGLDYEFACHGIGDTPNHYLVLWGTSELDVYLKVGRLWS